MAILLTLLAFALSSLAPTGASADPPPKSATATDALRRSFDEIMAMAQSPAFRALDESRRRDAIRKVADRVFNWSEMAKRSLGSHWDQRSASERRTFADWFAALAERAYTSSVAQLATRHVPPDAIKYLGETRSGSDTIVRTALTYPRELPIDFVMSKRGARWEVCDVRVDGVSAADNYRAQFQRIMATGSYPALVERMSAKTANAAPE
jgi:phospholipid transport system substrate-binding protein